MKIEVITLNKEDTLQAEKLGADRVELISAMQEGGLTPSYGTIKNVLKHTQIDAQIIVRPHSNGFIYDEKDWETIKEDISKNQQLGRNEIASRDLREDRLVDDGLVEKVMGLAPEIDNTFKRAVDEVTTQKEAYKTLCKFKNVKRILTSGGKAKAIAGIDQLQELVQLSKELDGPEILVGSGVSPDNLAQLHKEIGANEYHIGSGVRIDGDFSKGLSSEKMAQARKVDH